MYEFLSYALYRIGVVLVQSRLFSNFWDCNSL